MRYLKAACAFGFESRAEESFGRCRTWAWRAYALPNSPTCAPKAKAIVAEKAKIIANMARIFGLLDHGPFE